jgi:hypothetical protein
VKRRRGHSGERFIGLPHWLLTSAAWKALSPNAVKVLIHIWQRHNGTNNGQIVYAVRDAGEIGLSKSPAARALEELVELGFLRITRASAFTLKTKNARCWALTAERIDDQPATKDFMCWSPSKNKTQSPRRDPQSPRRDCEPPIASDYHVSVPQEGPSEPKSTLPQSPRRDTSNIPGGGNGTADPQPEPSSPAPTNRGRPLKFGDLAKAERTARGRT